MPYVDEHTKIRLDFAEQIAGHIRSTAVGTEVDVMPRSRAIDPDLRVRGADVHWVLVEYRVAWVRYPKSSSKCELGGPRTLFEAVRRLEKEIGPIGVIFPIFEARACYFGWISDLMVEYREWPEGAPPQVFWDRRWPVIHEMPWVMEWPEVVPGGRGLWGDQ